MCGIIGYLGDKEIAPLLIEGLKKLEYRGYDSAGICVIQENKLNSIKNKGRIFELEREIVPGQIKGNTGIAHTRWATHGEPNQVNAHPHLDCHGEIAIVHNGIIENFHALKELLKEESHMIQSDTDSEIIAHLIEKFYFGNLEEAVINALEVVEGAFGLAVIHKDKEEMVVARRGSPLIMGVGDNEMFVASDVPAILEHTKKVIYLHDDEVATITKKGYVIRNFAGEPIDKEVFEIKWAADQIQKGHFKHFMLKEIFEQPESIENTLRGRVKDSEIKWALNIDTNSIKKIIILACGTSWHAGLIGKNIIERFTGIPVEVDYASEFRYRDPIVNKNDLVIAISQSGETADTLAALKEAKLKGAKSMGIVNVVGSSVTREVDSGIYLHAGPEIGVASTKAFSCQITALLLFALYIKQQRGEQLNKQLLDEIKSIPEKVRKVLQQSQEIRNLAEKFKDNTNFLYLGRGLNFPVALEGALKLKEISYIHAEGYPAAEMKHGPIALVDQNMPVVFVAPKDHTYEKVLSNMEETKARGGKIIAVVDRVDKKIQELTQNIIHVPETISELTPIINSIPLQLLAYHIADLKGIDVDKPRNLAKSVTVE
ncbi:glutamine--fructose-6-phosphate transaminase (isomerizing) [Nanoarchaeota archaeon]